MKAQTEEQLGRCLDEGVESLRLVLETTRSFVKKMESIERAMRNDIQDEKRLNKRKLYIGDVERLDALEHCVITGCKDYASTFTKIFKNDDEEEEV